MQTKIRIGIAHKEYAGSFINKGATQLTTDLDAAITFRDISDASEWLLNCRYAPEDRECYTYKRIEIIKRVLEDEEEDGQLL